MIRPLRVYLHTFRSGAAQLAITRVGDTPCRAKAAAFTELERLIKEDDDLPKTGWALVERRDITNLVPAP